MPANGQRIPPEVRFWKHVIIRSPDFCWDWIGAKNHKGYGMFRWSPDTNSKIAHRVSWRLAKGSWPGMMFVLHSCNNPACVNPAHLRLGTHQDNMEDKRLAGNIPHGENSALAIVSRDDVISIIKMYKTGKFTQAELGEEFGIARTTVGSIVRGESWKHIDTKELSWE